MNPGFVADASVAVAWVVQSQSSRSTDLLLDEAETGVPIIVPTLWMFEVANSLLILRRRRRIEAQEYEQARIDLTDLRPAIDEEGPVLAFGRIIELADQYSLSVYDAAYLELALRKTIGLASRDSALNKAAKRAGVKTLL